MKTSNRQPLKEACGRMEACWFPEQDLSDSWVRDMPPHPFAPHLVCPGGTEGKYNCPCAHGHRAQEKVLERGRADAEKMLLSSSHTLSCALWERDKLMVIALFRSFRNHNFKFPSQTERLHQQWGTHGNCASRVMFCGHPADCIQLPVRLEREGWALRLTVFSDDRPSIPLTSRYWREETAPCFSPWQNDGYLQSFV